MDGFGFLADKSHWTTQRSLKLFAQVDAESVAEGGVEVRDLYGALGGVHAVFVGSSDNSAAFDSATGHHAAEDAGPMVASAAIVNARRASKFTENDDEGLFEFATSLEVGNERGDRGVHDAETVLA